MATIVAAAIRTVTDVGVSGNTSPSGSSSSVMSAPTIVNLSAAQAGDGASTNIVDRGASVAPVLLQLTSVIGATPTCTYAIEGSPDGANFFPIQYADSATPQTLVVTTFVITTSVTVYKLIPANIPVRYLRVTYSSNTNVSNTANLWVY